MTESMQPQLSVIIPTVGRPRYLRELLDALRQQTLDPDAFEVLVIDNAPEPAPPEGGPAIRYFHEPRPGLHSARHRGLREARSDILVFCDDDILPFPTWLEAVLSTFRKDPTALLVGGKSLPKYEADPPDWLDSLWVTSPYGRVNGWLSLIDLGDETRRVPPGYVYGCNFAVRRSVLEQCGGFHPDAMPWRLRHLRGDGETHVSEFLRERGLDAFYNPAASVHHRVPAERMTRAYLRRRAFLQAISYSYAVTRRDRGLLRRAITIARRIGEIVWTEILFAKGKPRAHWFHLIAGIFWHQARVLVSPSMREWIRKENYLD